MDGCEAGKPLGPLARVALALGIVAIAGCGGAATGGGPHTGPALPQYNLTITIWPHGSGGKSRTAILTCNPDGGTHPDPAKACAALDAHPEALHPVPGDVACTEIYGGDQVARLEGPGVKAVLNRTNGCEIARWDALAPVLEIS